MVEHEATASLKMLTTYKERLSSPLLQYRRLAGGQLPERRLNEIVEEKDSPSVTQTPWGSISILSDNPMYRLQKAVIHQDRQCNAKSSTETEHLSLKDIYRDGLILEMPFVGVVLSGIGSFHRGDETVNVSSDSFLVSEMKERDGFGCVRWDWLFFRAGKRNLEIVLFEAGPDFFSHAHNFPVYQELMQRPFEPEEKHNQIFPRKPKYDYKAPDATKVFAQNSLTQLMSYAHVSVDQGQTSIPVYHQSVSEVWYVSSGILKLRRKMDDVVSTLTVNEGEAFYLPLGVAFQTEALPSGSGTVECEMFTLPAWPENPVEAVQFYYENDIGSDEYEGWAEPTLTVDVTEMEGVVNLTPSRHKKKTCRIW